MDEVWETDLLRFSHFTDGRKGSEMEILVMAEVCVKRRVSPAITQDPQFYQIQHALDFSQGQKLVCQRGMG